MVLGTAVKCIFHLILPKSTLHALVDFGDDVTGIISFLRIVEESTNDGRCLVSQPDGKQHDAALIFTGTNKNKDCTCKQKEIEKDDGAIDDSDEENLNKDKSNGDTLDGDKLDGRQIG